MELRQIRSFLEAAKLCNFSQAANNLFVSQSTLSEQISKLEHELNCKLFHRIGKKVALTAEGKLIRDQCEQIMKLVYETTEILHDSRAGVKGGIRIGVLPTISLAWLPPFIANFSNIYPDIRCSIKELGSKAIEERVFNYQLDIGLTTLPSREAGLDSKVLYQERLVLISSQQSKFKDKACINLNEVQKEPFIIYERGYQLRNIILDKFFEVGINPNIIMETERTETIKYLVSHEYGVALVPESCVHYLPNPSIAYHHLDVPIIRTVGYVTRPDESRSGVIKTFVTDLLRMENKDFIKPLGGIEKLRHSHKDS